MHCNIEARVAAVLGFVLILFPYFVYLWYKTAPILSIWGRKLRRSV